MVKGRVLLNQEPFGLAIDRLCQQLIEQHGDFEDTYFVGIQQGGTQLTKRLVEKLKIITGLSDITYGLLDITFYRDDFRTRAKPLIASETTIDFQVENKTVILIDDVLYTGRTIQASLTAIQHYGRPKKVELLAMVDRRFNRHLPIQPDYFGITVDAVDEAYVKVEWLEKDEVDRILIFPNKESKQTVEM